MKYLLSIVCLALSACTYNISMAHTQGSATDIIDDNMSNTPSADIDLPDML